MTITYQNGTVLRAILLADHQHEIRAIAPGSGDVVAVTRTHGTWISEEIEPVTIQFDWQHRGATRVPTEADCICPKELAAHLIQTLISGDQHGRSGRGHVLCLLPAGSPRYHSVN